MRVLVLVIIAFSLVGCYESGSSRTPLIKTEALEAFALAQEAFRAGDNERALPHARAAYLYDPAFDGAAWLFASLLGRTGQYKEALEVSTQLSAKSPDLAQNHILEGILWELNGDRESANRAYDRAVLLRETSDSKGLEQIYVPLAVYLRFGKIRGVEAANQSLALFPDDITLHYLKRCMQDKEREFLIRWFSEGPKLDTETAIDVSLE